MNQRPRIQLVAINASFVLSGTTLMSARRPVGELENGDFTERAAVPIGTPEYRERICQKALEGTRRATSAVAELPTHATVTAPAVQCGLLLLRMCVHPRVIHLLRSSFSDVIIDLASSFDAAVRAGFEQLVGANVAAGSLAERQLQLPIRLGGCGPTPMLRIAPAAYLGSWMLCLKAVELRVGAQVLGPNVPETSVTACVARAEQALLRGPREPAVDWRPIAARPMEQGQRALMTARNRAARVALLAAETVRGRTRVQCCTGTVSGAFLTAVPVENELALSNTDMRLAIRLRLGLPLSGASVWCSRCRARVDVEGNHFHACHGNSTIRHNRLRDMLEALLRRAGLEVMSEQEEPRLRHRPDLRVEQGLPPSLAYLDVSVAHATAPSANHAEGARNPDAAVREAWRVKVKREYAPLSVCANFRLIPAVATTHGSWHPDMLRFLAECAQRVGSANPSVPGASALPQAVLQGWICRLSIALQRQNAAMARRCVPAGEDFGLDRPWAEGPPLLWEQVFMSCACDDAEDGAGDLDQWDSSSEQV